jgi:hypothetical protein
MEVLVFKTSVETTSEVKSLRSALDLVAGRGKWNFALDDCDRILRIASGKVNAQTAIKTLNEMGYDCAELMD